MIGADGVEIPGGGGYKYFGVAKDLPGVKELLEKAAAPARKKTRLELLQV